MASVRRRAAARGAERPNRGADNERANKTSNAGGLIDESVAPTARKQGDAYNNQPNERRGFSDRFGERGSNKPVGPGPDGGDNWRSNSPGTAPPNDYVKEPSPPGFKPNPKPQAAADRVMGDAGTQPEAKPPYVGENIQGGRGGARNDAWATARSRAKARLKR